jgi:hypothetical protein
VLCDCGWWGELGPHYRKVPPTDEKGIEAERRDYEVMMRAFNALNASAPLARSAAGAARNVG